MLHWQLALCLCSFQSMDASFFVRGMLRFAVVRYIIVARVVTVTVAAIIIGGRMVMSIFFTPVVL